jgi:hypothetical protein
MEDFRTAFASVGWDLNVVYEQADVPAPAGVDPNKCWERSNLHGLMDSAQGRGQEPGGSGRSDGQGARYDLLPGRQRLLRALWVPAIGSTVWINVVM